MRHCKATLCACAFAAATVLSVLAEECVALRPGEVEVVLPEKPFPVERFAAHEMTNILSRVLGAPVPMSKPAITGYFWSIGRRNAGAALQAWQRLLPNGRP